MFDLDARAPAPAPTAPAPRSTSTTPRPVTKPVAAPAAPAPAPVLTRIAAADLVALLDSDAARNAADDDAARVLVIDVRPLSEYAAGHIKGAINLCLPSTLLRRTSFGLDRALANVAVPAHRARLRSWAHARAVILFDAGNETDRASPGAAQLAAKLAHAAVNAEHLPPIQFLAAQDHAHLPRRLWVEGSPTVSPIAIAADPDRHVPSASTPKRAAVGMPALALPLAAPHVGSAAPGAGVASTPVLRSGRPVPTTLPPLAGLRPWGPRNKGASVMPAMKLPTTSITPTATATADGNALPDPTKFMEEAPRTATPVAPSAPGPQPTTAAAPTACPVSALAAGRATPASLSLAPTAAAGKPRKRPNLSLSSLPFKAGSPGSTASFAAAAGPKSPRINTTTVPSAAPVPLRINLAHVRAMTASAGLALRTQFPLLSSLGAHNVAPYAPVWLHALFASGGAMSELQGAFLRIKMAEAAQHAPAGGLGGIARTGAAPGAPRELGETAGSDPGKNRYCNVYPFEYNRVKLQRRAGLVAAGKSATPPPAAKDPDAMDVDAPVPGPATVQTTDAPSDYINASLIYPLFCGNDAAVSNVSSDAVKAADPQPYLANPDCTRVPAHVVRTHSNVLNDLRIAGTPGCSGGGCTFIATQAPLPHTTRDFWDMVYDHGVRVVVNLAPETEIQAAKAHKYWPDTAMHVDNLTVALVNESRRPFGIVVRHLAVAVRHGDSAVPPLETTHVSFEEWPDGDAPSVDALVTLLECVNDAQDRAGAKAPVVVHCSAGCGRTGTFIAMHALARLVAAARAEITTASDSRAVFRAAAARATAPACPRYPALQALMADDPVPRVVTQLRAQRVMMVQTAKQYMFLYELFLTMLQRSPFNFIDPVPPSTPGAGASAAATPGQMFMMTPPVTLARGPSAAVIEATTAAATATKAAGAGAARVAFAAAAAAATDTTTGARAPPLAAGPVPPGLERRASGMTTPATPLLLTSQEVEMVDQGCYFAAIATPVPESAPASRRESRTTSRAVSRAPSPTTDDPMDIDIVVTPPRPPALGRSATATAPLGRAGIFTRPYVLPAAARMVSPPPPPPAPSPDVPLAALRSAGELLAASHYAPAWRRAMGGGPPKMLRRGSVPVLLAAGRVALGEHPTAGDKVAPGARRRPSHGVVVPAVSSP
ncbi:protein tyrosine phosphatase, non-receptor type 12 [Allomyces arbusculus]|nr:protein tyrosine phosphatase, non-receptor type 12 [Allomyces arbusculus]